MAPMSKKNTLSGADVLCWTTAQQSVSAPPISSAPLGAHLEISVERTKEPTATSTDQLTRTAFFSYVLFFIIRVQSYERWPSRFALDTCAQAPVS